MLKKLWDRYWTWRATDGKIIHTLVIARLKLVVGTAFTGLQQSGVDVAGWVTTRVEYQNAIRVFMAILTLDGTLSEWARRHKADDVE